MCRSEAIARSWFSGSYDGKILDKFTFRAWVSDDPSRVPLRLEATSKWGVLVGELIGYTAPPEL